MYTIEEKHPIARHRPASQYEDGDRKKSNIIDSLLEQSEQERDIEQLVKTKPIRDEGVRRPNPPYSTFHSVTSHEPLFRVDPSICSRIRHQSWRKLRANITPVHYKNIQHFQRERAQRVSLCISPPHPSYQQIDSVCSNRDKTMSHIISSPPSATSILISIERSEDTFDCEQGHRMKDSTIDENDDDDGEAMNSIEKINFDNEGI